MWRRGKSKEEREKVRRGWEKVRRGGKQVRRRGWKNEEKEKSDGKGKKW